MSDQVVLIGFGAEGKRELLRLRRRVENPGPMLKAFGRLLVRESQRAFEEQQFGEFAWPSRYPSGGVNIAGSLADLNRGKMPPARRFEPRPALIDKAMLRRSITSSVDGDTVTVGSSLPYAGKHQRGGTETQPVTQKAKDTLLKFLKTPLGRAKGRPLRFLFRRDSLSTKVHRRPFIGVTERGEEALRGVVERFIETGKAGAA